MVVYRGARGAQQSGGAMKSAGDEGAGEPRTFLPSGPYIPVSEIPNEIKRFFETKKHPFQGRHPPAPLRPDEIRRFTLLAEAALVLFVCLVAVLALVLLCFCVAGLVDCCRRSARERARKREAKRRSQQKILYGPGPAAAASAPPSSKRGWSPPQSLRSSARSEASFQGPAAPRITVSTVQGDAAGDYGFRSPLPPPSEYRHRLSLNRSLGIYEELGPPASSQHYEPITAASATASSSGSGQSSFGDYPDVPPALVNRFEREEKTQM